MWPSARCIKLRIGIYLLCTNFLSIKRRHAPYRLVLINLTADSHLRRRRSRICNHKQTAIRSSENQTDRIRRKIPLPLTTLSLTILWRIVRVVGGRLYWKGLRNGMWLVVFVRSHSRLWQSSFHHGKNETVLILLSQVLSSLWLCLWFWFSVFNRSEVLLQPWLRLRLRLRLWLRRQWKPAFSKSTLK